MCYHNPNTYSCTNPNTNSSTNPNTYSCTNPNTNSSTNTSWMFWKLCLLFTMSTTLGRMSKWNSKWNMLV